MRLIVTTTRHTNPRIRSFVKELAISLGNSIRANRGKRGLLALHLYARSLNASRVVIVGRGLYGNPGRITFLDTTHERPRYYPLVLRLSGVSLARDMGLKIGPSKTITPIVSSGSDTELIELAQELAGAFNRPFFEGVSEDLLEEYEKVLVIERVRTKKAKFIVKFMNKDGKPAGPKMFVRDVILKELPVAQNV